MRLRVNLDRIEEGLNRRRTDGKSIGFIFPPVQTPHIETVAIKAVLRHALFCLLLIITCFVIFFAFLPFIAAVVVFIDYNTHHVHHAPWHLFALVYRMGVKHLLSQGTPAEYALTILGLDGTNLAFLLASRWAWNRRAHRLNREASLPQPALAIDIGVWPPPPNVSEQR